MAIDTLAIVAAFLAGSYLCLLGTIYLVFISSQKTTEFLHNELIDLQDQLAAKIEDFKMVGEKASAANQSFGRAVGDFEMKIADLENRISILRMQR